MSAAYELKNVVKSYRMGEGETQVLNGIDLSIPEGQFVAIVGPSGSGKSTLLTLLGCLDVPSGGSLRVMGQEVGAIDDEQLSLLRARTLGFVFQSFNLLPAYDAVSNVALGCVYSGKDRAGERAAHLLTTVGLGHRLRHRPNTLSGGEKQRVAIARALINEPRILLADEPTGALDQKNGGEILSLLESIHRSGRTVILVTHDLSVAARAQRVIVITDGRILRDIMSGPA